MYSNPHINKKYISRIFTTYKIIPPPKTKKRTFQARQQRKHHRRLEEIALDPSLIGIKEITRTPIIEHPIHKEEKSGEIDVIILGKNIVYYVEYKLNDSHDLRKHAKKQLYRAVDLVESEFRRENTKLLYVFGHFEAYLLDERGFFVPFNNTSWK